jgi:anaerobic magnesium-protoporphyrin IX monomethyl ester cyclase
MNYNSELKHRGLRIPFETISRADRMMKEETLAALAELGCYRIWIGSESGSQRILDAMQRGVTVEQVQWATRAAQRHGIQVGMFLMWGYEGETAEDIEATIDHVKKANPDIFFTTVAYPIKNTTYFKEVSDRVVVAEPWERSTDRDLRIRGRHSRGYYKAADRLLRSEVEAFRLEPRDPEAAALKREEAGSARAAMSAASGEVEA